MAEVLLAKGSMIGQVFRKIGVTKQTYYRWRRDSLSLSVDQAKRLKKVGKKNARFSSFWFGFFGLPCVGVEVLAWIDLLIKTEHAMKFMMLLLTLVSFGSLH